MLAYLNDRFASKGAIFIAIFSWLGLLSFGVSIIGNPIWLANDDQAMASVASGTYTGEPSGQLVHVNRLLGEVLALLYRSLPSVAWYAWLLMATVIISFSAVCKEFRGRYLAGWFVVSSILTTWIALRPNFTVVAFVAASAGAALVARGLTAGHFPVSGLSLIFVGALWRFDSALFSMLAAIPILALSIQQGKRTHWAKYVSIIGVVGMIFFAVPRIARACYWSTAEQCSNWLSYLDYIGILATIHGRPRADVFAVTGDLSGNLSPTATNLLLNNSNAVSPEFDLDRVTEMAGSIPIYLRLLGNSPSTHVDVTLASVEPFYWLIGGSLLMVFIPWMVSRPMLWKQSTIVAVLTLIFGLSLLSASALIKLTSYNAAGATFATIILINSLAARNDNQVRNINPFAVTGVQLLGLTFIFLWAFVSLSGFRALEDEARDRYLRNSGFLATLQSSAGSQKVFGQGNLASLMDTDPYSVGAGPDQTRLLLGGWMVYSPNWFVRSDMLGIGSVYPEFIRSSTDPSNNSLLFAGGQTNANLLATFLGEIDPSGRQYQVIEAAQLTADDDVVVGPTYLWRVVSTESE